MVMSEMMSAGIEIMLMGMGIVFLFLAMLIIAVNIMSSLVARFSPEIVDNIATGSNEVDSNVVAAISVAVHQYRNQHKS